MNHFASLLLVLGLLVPIPAPAQDKPAAPKQVTHQITGLFSPDREKDLRDLFTKIPDIKLISVDFENAEAVLEYDAATRFPDAKTPEQLIEQLNNAILHPSRGAFGVKPLRTIPKDKLKLIEIDVAGLDCKGCSLGAYLAVFRLPGVEKATASFKIGKVTALVDPEKIDRATLEKELKAREVTILPPKAR